MALFTYGNEFSLPIKIEEQPEHVTDQFLQFTKNGMIQNMTAKKKKKERKAKQRETGEKKSCRSIILIFL